ncbi:MAG: DUF58 domain-containing protein [Oligoflexia bacterium]|nr:DUF58 domain-containing protein [Oligoflexia bacterium]
MYFEKKAIDISTLATMLEVFFSKMQWTKDLGVYQSYFKGQGMLFSDVRKYTESDDIRHIDWNVSARTGTPHVKCYTEERNLEIVIAIDCSENMCTGDFNQSKLKIAIEICSLLLILSEQSHDWIRPVLLSDKVVDLGCSSGRGGICKLLHELKKMGLLHYEISRKKDADWSKSYFESEIIFGKEEKRANAELILKKFTNKKSIIILSDFYNLLEEGDLLRLQKLSAIHFVKIVSKIDKMKFLPFTLRAHSSADPHRKEQTIGTLLNCSRGKFTLDRGNERIVNVEVGECYVDTIMKWLFGLRNAITLLLLLCLLQIIQSSCFAEVNTRIICGEERAGKCILGEGDILRAKIEIDVSNTTGPISGNDLRYLAQNLIGKFIGENLYVADVGDFAYSKNNVDFIVGNALLAYGGISKEESKNFYILGEKVIFIVDEKIGFLQSDSEVDTAEMNPSFFKIDLAANRQDYTRIIAVVVASSFCMILILSGLYRSYFRKKIAVT